MYEAGTGASERYNFFSSQSSNETVLFEIAPQTIDDLFCHRFQTDQLFVVRGSMVLVCLQNRQYHYILVSDRIPQAVKIPAGVPHLVINLTFEPCWVINALIRHGVAHPKDYQPIKKPFPLDMERVKKLFA
jgi:uncharacterized RmlC-like cupin family protein